MYLFNFQLCLIVENQYKESLKPLQFQSCNIPCEYPTDGQLNGVSDN